MPAGRAEVPRAAARQEPGTAATATVERKDAGAAIPPRRK